MPREIPVWIPVKSCAHLPALLHTREVRLRHEHPDALPFHVRDGDHRSPCGNDLSLLDVLARHGAIEWREKHQILRRRTETGGGRIGQIGLRSRGCHALRPRPFLQQGECGPDCISAGGSLRSKRACRIVLRGTDHLLVGESLQAFRVTTRAGGVCFCGGEVGLPSAQLFCTRAMLEFGERGARRPGARAALLFVSGECWLREDGERIAGVHSRAFDSKHPRDTTWYRGTDLDFHDFQRSGGFDRVGRRAPARDRPDEREQCYDAEMIKTHAEYYETALKPAEALASRSAVPLRRLSRTPRLEHHQMADSRSQDLSSHRRWVPLYHFFALPILFANVVLSAWYAYRFPTRWNIWVGVVAIALALIGLFARTMALKVQDRVIRLEQTLRMMRVLSGPVAARIGELTPNHFVGLRFASDAELPGLVERCLSGELKGGEDVKKQVKSWQADWLRA